MKITVEELKKNLAGHTMVLIQLFISFAFAVMVWETQLLPGKYIAENILDAADYRRQH